MTRHRLTRLYSDGTVDPTINFGLGADSFVSTLVVQPEDDLVAVKLPALRRKLAIVYSRLSLAIKLALISAGQTASHS